MRPRHIERRRTIFLAGRPLGAVSRLPDRLRPEAPFAWSVHRFDDSGGPRGVDDARAVRSTAAAMPVEHELLD